MHETRSVNRRLIEFNWSSMLQSGDKNESATGGSEQTVPPSELRATIAEMLKEALSDHKVGKGKQKTSNSEGRMC